VKAVGEWFPMRDRALAVGIFNAGTAIGSVAAAPIVSILAVHWGWRSAFLVTGALGFVWLIPWMLFFRQPKSHPCLSEEERQLILDGQCEETGKPRPAPLLRLLRMRETWGCILVRALTDPISYFLLFWIPLYFQKQHAFDLKKMALFMWIPYAAAALGNLAGGIIPRFLIGRGWELDQARKRTMLFMTGTLLVCLLSVSQVASPALALALVAGMTFCHGGWSNITLPAEVFPKNAIATVTGLGGALGSWVGALAMLTTGHAVDACGFTPIFIAYAVLNPTALLLVYVLIGKLGVVRNIE
jgi:ACS family hexuronate transporter-like MFS transporter